MSPSGWAYYVLDLPSATWGWALDLTSPNTCCPGYYLAYGRTPSDSESGNDASTTCLDAGDNTTNTALGFTCSAACATDNAKRNGAAGAWVLGATAYLNAAVDASATLLCFPPPPPPASSWRQAVQLRLRAPIAAAKFDAGMQELFRRAVALAAAVSPAQVSLSVVSGTAAGARADLGPESWAPARRLLAGATDAGTVLVDVVVGGLADTTAAAATAQRLTLNTINAQMAGQGLPAVQVCPFPAAPNLMG